MITIEFIVIILCLLIGTRFGGMGLGLISGIGLFVLSFVFGLQPGKPPVDVMLTILAVIGCAATLQTAGGLNVMMQFAERLLRKHPQHITLLAPFTTWMLTFLCGTGHVVYTMFPIIADIALKKGIRPERPMAVASVASQMAITASPVSVAVVSLVSILGAQHGIGHAWGILEILAVSVPASLSGVAIAALWSLRRGKNLADDPEFQEKLKDPKQREFIFGGTETLMDQRFPKQAYWSTWIFFAGIAVVVLLGALPELRPAFEIKGKTTALSMNLVIQMMMLIAGAIMLMTCKVNASAISNGAVFKAGMVAIFSVFGVAWMSDTFFQAHLDELKMALEGVVKSHPWTYAIVLFLVSKLVNSQAAALTAVAPMGLMLGIDPKMLVAFFPASYGYFVLPTYPSDLACIGFDRSGTTRIGKFIINHSFILPGLIGVSCACVVSYLLVQTFF
ncbi:TPA: anaerobic C4-dicarboxylate transporter [Enterobacter hormaechei subsp. steigerwaltii]|uniref:anaerobic C4-dicarboxylate transporter n=1 Tax=Enterobacter hormaechei TaxID=158836 RepID=UPI00030DBDE4|nr:anaerobic C4-dicarboxylate transporter [Enterobacter hormaechei]CAE7609511.1 Anaerobic C4-dicarboxylate transporter DcuB [Enterobacter cloacae]HCJ7344731.1 anaerobic C4-dicarboxylate transporter [Enterobacter hormaechei subsp. xiangfangensis]AXO51860.1 anaerobic C4-dicarboxylate transporter [Enterobacter hormaechei]EKK5501077.1 anaerobic C4-dicarboxylate transporter [Enterobacter hormaechei]EKY3878527.1 anaerobic C4-dicarboxylate transporter [Enterobacter hormaechei]